MSTGDDVAWNIDNSILFNCSLFHNFSLIPHCVEGVFVCFCFVYSKRLTSSCHSGLRLVLKWSAPLTEVSEQMRFCINPVVKFFDALYTDTLHSFSISVQHNWTKLVEIRPILDRAYSTRRIRDAFNRKPDLNMELFSIVKTITVIANIADIAVIAIVTHFNPFTIIPV